MLYQYSELNGLAAFMRGIETPASLLVKTEHMGVEPISAHRQCAILADRRMLQYPYSSPSEPVGPSWLCNHSLYSASVNLCNPIHFPNGLRPHGHFDISVIVVLG